ncbi:hypothetical protein BDD12DRAFT_856099 [Trichophaea hybrida]|nr:hypothetical protein BDD12DRAFT_856099 [Trichophaea hybrida]
MAFNLLALTGFGTLGPVAGSLAAAWQASIGNVAAGSLFATLQSCGMTGVCFVPGVGWVVVTLVAGGYIYHQLGTADDGD